MLDSERLRSFVVFSESMNFTRAAEARRISQPALFAQVAKLGEEVGTPLYYREGRKLLLTEAGRSVEAFGRDMIARTESFMAQIDGRAAPRVVMSAGAGAYLDLLGEGIRSFLRSAKSRPELLVADAPTTIEHVERGRAALGVVAGLAPADLEHEELASVPMMVAMPRQHPLTKRRRIAARHLADVPLVVPPAGRPLRQNLDLALHEITPTVAVEASGWSLMLEFVRMGLGVAVVNGNVRLPSGLVARAFTALPPTSYALVTRRGDTFGDGAKLSQALIEHRDAWRERPRTAWALSR